MNWDERDLENYLKRTGKTVTKTDKKVTKKVNPESTNKEKINKGQTHKEKVSQINKKSKTTQKATSQKPHLTKLRHEQIITPIKRHKFGAVKVTYKNKVIDSISKRNHLQRLDELKNAGEVLFYLRQVKFELTGDQDYICDMQVFWKCGSVTFEDPKGFETPVFRMKMKLMEVDYPYVCIECITAKGERYPATKNMKQVRQIPDILQNTSLILDKKPSPKKSYRKNK